MNRQRQIQTVLGAIKRLEPPGRLSGLQGNACGIKSECDRASPSRQAQKAQCARLELRLDQISAILAGGDGGPALVPGKPGDSMLIKAISYRDEDLQMPPKEELPAEEKALLEQWVALGAPWPAGAVPVAHRD